MSLWSLACWVLSALIGLLALGLVLPAWSAGWDMGAAVDKGVQLWAKYARVIDRIYDFVDRAARFIVPIATIGGAIYGVYHKVAVRQGPYAKPKIGSPDHGWSTNSDCRVSKRPSPDLTQIGEGPGATHLLSDARMTAVGFPPIR
jgi:hypothetical protein